MTTPDASDAVGEHPAAGERAAGHEAAPLLHADDPATTGRTLASSTLLKGARCVQIEHNGAVYRLQATRLGKLILTK